MSTTQQTSPATAAISTVPPSVNPTRASRRSTDPAARELFSWGRESVSEVSPPESSPVLAVIVECSNHLGADKIAVELIQLIQPEVVTRVVRIRRLIRVTAQVTEVLHQDEGAIEFGVNQVLIFRHRSQHLRPCLSRGRQITY